MKPIRDMMSAARTRLFGATPSGRMLRVGFVGCGQHARTNLYPCLQYAPVDLTAVCARRMESAESTGRLFGARAAYDDYRAMFEKEVLDAVFVCVNAREHVPIATAALERGLHVFLEKPAAPTLEDVERLRDIERRAGRRVMVGFQKRFAPAYLKAREIMNDRSFGALSAIDTRLCVGSFPDEEAFLLEVAIHHLDLLRFFAGDLESLHVEKRGSASKAFTYAAVMRFQSGAIGSMRLSSEFSWHDLNERVELCGQGQSVVIDNMVAVRHYRRADATWAGGPYAGAGSAFWEPNFTVPTIQNQTLHLNGFAGEVSHFVECALAGREPQSGLEDFSRAMRLREVLLGRRSLEEWRA